VIDIVGLTFKNLKSSSIPNIKKFFNEDCFSPMIPSFPAVTCSVQASITSGFLPNEHGIISNGYYDRDLKKVSFWEQEDNLVQKPRVWDILKNQNSKLKIAVLFWQNSLYINSDIIITPKPIHLDEQTIMWCYSKPVNYYEEILKEIGEFDLRSYWGPFASIKSSQWIIDSAKYTIKKEKPDLIFVYLPHLDYAAQKNGPDSVEFTHSLSEIDTILGIFFAFLEEENLTNEYEIMLISEYGFNKVNESISPNMILNQNNFLSTRKIAGKEYIDFEFSKAFAIADHQIAHVFIKSGYEEEISSLFKKEQGVFEILDKNSQKRMGINHPKSGELILCARNNCWFNYFWWSDEKYAPLFTFNVDIHRKPGFDPLELFLEPATKTISHDTSLIKGSHGIFNEDDSNQLPCLAMSMNPLENNKILSVTQLAPTITKFFDVNYEFPEKSIL